MRYIKKSEIEPRDLREYKKNCRKASPPLKITYKDMPKDGTRQQLARDQGYLCAYCMRRISLDPADQLNYLNIEHLDPQNQLPVRQLQIFQIFWACVPEIGVLRRMQKRLAMPTVESWKKISRQCA